MQQHRRILQNPFTKPKVVQYKSLQTKEAHQAVKGMMQNPLQWELELKRFAIAIVLNIGYGVKVSDTKHPYIKLADDAGYATAHSGPPASSIVDRLPIGELFILHSKTIGGSDAYFECSSVFT
jgi:cytochrome P450